MKNASQIIASINPLAKNFQGEIQLSRNNGMTWETYNLTCTNSKQNICYNYINKGPELYFIYRLYITYGPLKFYVPFLNSFYWYSSIFSIKSSLIKIPTDNDLDLGNVN